MQSMFYGETLQWAILWSVWITVQTAGNIMTPLRQFNTVFWLRLLRAVGFGAPLLAPLQITAVLEKFDKNGDGKLDYNEFKKLLKR